jgi:hypothetical protein
MQKVRIAVNEETNEVDRRGCAPAQSYQIAMVR